MARDKAVELIDDRLTDSSLRSSRQMDLRTSSILRMELTARAEHDGNEKVVRLATERLLKYSLL